MNAMTPTDQNRLTTSPQLSPALRSLLDGADQDRAVEAITNSPVLMAETKAKLGELKAFASRRAGETGVRDVIGKRFALYPQPKRSAEEWAAWWSDYYACLADVPPGAIEAAMAEWVARPASDFLPKPGKLLEMALAARSPEIQAFELAKRAVIEGQTIRARSGPRADREEVLRFAAEFAAQVAERKPGAPKFKPPQGDVDEGGITPELRAVIARQRGVA